MELVDCTYNESSKGFHIAPVARWKRRFTQQGKPVKMGAYGPDLTVAVAKLAAQLMTDNQKGSGKGSFILSVRHRELDSGSPYLFFFAGPGIQNVDEVSPKLKALFNLLKIAEASDDEALREACGDLRAEWQLQESILKLIEEALGT